MGKDHVYRMFTEVGPPTKSEADYDALMEELVRLLPEPDKGIGEKLTSRLSDAVCALVIDAMDSAARRYGNALREFLTDGLPVEVWHNAADPQQVEMSE